MKIRSIPTEKEAIQWTGDNIAEICEFMYPAKPVYMAGFSNSDEILGIDTLEGRMVGTKGDYIIKGINGEFYPCKPDIFNKSYEIIT